MSSALPSVPWQITGNSWITIPCIHPADGSIHGVGLLSAAARGAIEIGGSATFEDGAGTPLLRPLVERDGERIDLATTRMAWQRVVDWLPAFSATVDDLVVRGTVVAPHGRTVDHAGFVYVLNVENRGSRTASVRCGIESTFGARRRRVRTSVVTDDAPRARRTDDGCVVCDVAASPFGTIALCGDECDVATHEQSGCVLARELTIPPATSADLAIYVGAAMDADGAIAMATSMRSRGWRSLADATRESLATMQQTTGVPSLDRLLNRHLVAAYFGAAGRAIDDARWYLVRSRLPWCAYGMTTRDWDALMWTIPAVQLADPVLARELLIRMCELHGYAPGRGVNYLDGTPFELAPSLDSVAAYPVAVDRYIAGTRDDAVVEEGPIADALYAAHDEIVLARNATHPLYRTEHTASGARAPLPYALHTNAIVADALEILKATLDEKAAETVEDPAAARAAVLRQFAADEGARATLVTAIDLHGAVSRADDPVASAYWLPLYHLLERDDSIYRRTVRRLESADNESRLAARCAMATGPDADKLLDWLRRAPLDGGIAAEFVDADGRAVSRGGDAALSGLVAYAVWYAAGVLGATAG